MRKNYIIKSYSQDGTFLGIITDADFRGFTKSLTDGLGECVFSVGKKFDAVDATLAEGNHVEIWVADKDSNGLVPIAAVRVYQGEITLILPDIDGSQESMEVHLTGYGARFGLDLLKSSTQTNLATRTSGGIGTTMTAQAVDIGTVVRAIVDRYIAETSSPRIGYTATSIPTVGTNMTYLFMQRTYLEGIEKALASAPFGYFTYLDANGLMNFRAAASTPTHKFIFGKHFTKIRVQRSIERLRNFVVIWDGASTYKKYEDTASIAKYGRRVERINDPGIKDSTTMDQIGAKFLAEHKSAEIQFVCTIIDNAGSDTLGYDIESIQPGDTCSFFNFNSSIAALMRDNMIITQVEYQPNQATITVEPIRYGITDIAEKLKKQISETQTTVGATTIPNTYT